ncbi:hypothetical protein KO527_20365 [Pseudoalteromonas sp. C2R02]|uniref:hypothetical protein n=1 Tax=Pseudoalteromonas sp. C2R02 TaxID=2841565 RepID=UPI001C095ED5|nr:hypothetical protein [Pseudoalteromonas sp. C2R02]MBU2971708.1 hypothetical protein [Pseudoalteromonas sp. C2R02]
MIIPGIPFILGSLGFITYAFWPRDLSSVINIPLNSKAEFFSVSAHGVKDNPDSWSDELQKLIKQNNIVKSQQNISLNWSEFSDNVFICSVSAKKIGHQLGQRLLKETKVKSIHVIGHSCGAFVALGLCEAVKEQSSDIKIQTTYLDPVSVYAGVWWNYGIDKFGTCADFSDSYIDTRDGVPGSNINLPYTATFDVTELGVKNNNMKPHNWPTQYYLSAYRNKKVPLIKETPQLQNYDLDKLITTH